MPKSQRVRIEGATGAELAGLLEISARPGAPCALFAHCFTCSKDSIAAARVSRALAERGFTVLRLDFTGLGESEGDFADTTFSSNLDDLRTAAAWLATHHGPPALLVGHSLGGAAVLASAGDIDGVRAVVTIGAPAEPAHVERLLKEAAPEIEARGEAQVQLGGRPFCIRRQFVDDLRQHDLAAEVARLKLPLLIMHSPIDTVVSVDNAAAIFGAARHPKSYVSLDDADHLLRRREDAEYAAEVIAAWAQRYVQVGETEAGTSGTEAPAPEPGEVIVEENGAGRFAQDVRAGRHVLAADEPPGVGGDDTGMSPYDFVVAGLGACTSMTLRMYADRKGWPLERVRVRLRHQKVHAKDCEDCETTVGMLDEIHREVVIEGDLDAEQRARLGEIADRCPVHRTLTGEIKVRTRLPT